MNFKFLHVIICNKLFINYPYVLLAHVKQKKKLIKYQENTLSDFHFEPTDTDKLLTFN